MVALVALLTNLFAISRAQLERMEAAQEANASYLQGETDFLADLRSDIAQ